MSDRWQLNAKSAASKLVCTLQKSVCGIIIRYVFFSYKVISKLPSPSDSAESDEYPLALSLLAIVFCFSFSISWTNLNVAKLVSY